ncbi:uncharacterized protein J3R85_008109 [Psidium guajava]|nr:uncharacterized protein J3R85_008109 [Psidium guajava]
MDAIQRSYGESNVTERILRRAILGGFKYLNHPHVEDTTGYFRWLNPAARARTSISFTVRSFPPGVMPNMTMSEVTWSRVNRSVPGYSGLRSCSLSSTPCTMPAMRPSSSSGVVSRTRPQNYGVATAKKRPTQLKP